MSDIREIAEKYSHSLAPDLVEEGEYIYAEVKALAADWLKLTAPLGKEFLRVTEEGLEEHGDNPAPYWLTPELLRALLQEVRNLTARDLTLRKRVHAIERHNQYFERCESAWCNPNPPLAAISSFGYDPASMPHGDAFAVRQTARIEELTAAREADRREIETLTNALNGEIRIYEAAREQQGREIAGLRDALEILSRLGNGEHPGNSTGNTIAQRALAAVPPVPATEAPEGEKA